MDDAVRNYIEAIDNDQRKSDMYELVSLISDISSETPKMWGTSIISFGLYSYKYESGREGEAPKIGLSSRKQAIVLYGLSFSDSEHPNSKLLKKLGTYKTGKGCLYIAKLTDIHIPTFKEIIRNASSN